jgi:hypothetical protein
MMGKSQLNSTRQNADSISKSLDIFEIIAKETDSATAKYAKILNTIESYEETESNFDYETQKTFDINFITRRNVTLTIISRLNIGDSHQVNNWIDRLIAHGYLEPNPHTTLSTIKKIYKPTPDTRYFLNHDLIEKFKMKIQKVIDSYNRRNDLTKEKIQSTENKHTN